MASLLYAEAHGTGLPVLLSCGLCTTHENWRPQVEPWVAAGLRVCSGTIAATGARRRRTTRPPTRCSRSSTISGACSPGARASSRPSWAGSRSAGSLRCTSRSRSRSACARCCSIDTGPGFKNPEAQARWEAQVERTASFLETRGCQAFVESKAAATAIGLRPELPAAQAAARAIAAQDPPGLALFARRVAGVAPPVIDQLAAIEIPALVVVGEKDEPYLRAAEVLAARLRKAESVRIPRAGHVVNLEEPAGLRRGRPRLPRPPRRARAT